MRPLKLALALVMMSGLAAVGCSSAAEDPNMEDAVADGEDELTSAAWQKLLGAFDVTNAPVTPPTIQHIVFSPTADHNGHHFFADVDTGIRCFRAPCPSNARVEGYFTATSKQLRLTAVGADGVSLGGQYKYTLSGDKLSLTKSGKTTKLEKRDGSYCTQASDCNAQGIIHPMCVGHFTCGGDQTCGYKCGVAPICPELAPPGPGFCPNGDIVPRKGADGCVTGFDCEPKGVQCGNATCAAGDVCCNPVMGICTKPGMFCIQ